MVNSVGQGTFIQPNIIQDSLQQNAQKNIQTKVDVQSRTQDRSSTQVEVSGNSNFQKIAQDILAKRAENTESFKPAFERGQIVNLLV